MKIGRLAIPLTAIAAVVILGAFTAGLIANAVLASEPGPERPALPTPEPGDKPVLFVQGESQPLVKSQAPNPGRERTAKGEGSDQGTVYTWEDGDRTQRVVLQDDLVVQNNDAITPGDDVVARGVGDSIVRKHPRHTQDDPPVFRSESGGGLMTLPGGVLLALDPEWDEDMVDSFFSENGISKDRTSELGFIENGFVVETEPGFSALELANELAAQDGVVISSPNWWREVETK
jgi:hypothetical protein